MSSNLAPSSSGSAFLSQAIAPLLSNKASFAQKNVCRAFLAALPSDIERAKVIKVACNELTEEEKVEVLKLAPFGRWTWGLVDALKSEAQKKYWSEVNAEWIRYLSAGFASSFLILTPVFGLTSAFLLLGELLTGWQWTGVLIILLSVSGIQYANTDSAR